MTTLAVLAGGEGRRMGAPKDLLTVDGRPVLRSLLERFRWEGPTLLVASFGGRLPSGHEAFDEVVHDAESGEGPLRGILTALCAGMGESEFVIVPVDMPGLGREHIEWVERELKARPGAAGILLVRDEGIEPFPCGFRRAAVQIIDARLRRGQRSVQGLAQEAEVEVVRPPREWGERVWRNVNEPGDLPEGWQRG